MRKQLYQKFLLGLFFNILLVSYAKAQPANDNPCNATAITVGATCTFTQYTNLNATNTPGVGNPGCANYSGGDVWFSAVVPASGSITFDTNTGTMTDGGMAIYTGTCSALTLLDCNDDGSANGLMPSITETGLTPGTTVFIRVWEYGNDNNGTFSICAQVGPTCSGSNNNATCATASPFCTGVSYDYCNTTGVPSIGGSGIYDCLLTAPNPAFFFMNIASTGPITFNISQQTFGGVGIDVDFVLWGPFASQAAVCSGISAANAIDCSYSTAAVETATIPNAVAGQWYMILITNFSDQEGVINFSQTNSGNAGAGVTNCNIVTAAPGACAGGFYTLTGAVTVPAPPASGTLTVTNSCGGSQVINAPFTSPINYSIPNICGNGNNCTVSAVFSAGGAPVVLPTSYTAPSCNTLTATPGACVAGGYALSGSLTTGCLPTTGTLTITSSCGGSVTFNAPFTSPLAWSLPVSNGTGGSCTVTAVYSAAGAPIITPFTFTEPSCCGSDAGTVTVTHTGGTQTTLANGTTQVVLCPGGTVKLNSSNDYVLPDSGCLGCIPGLMYAIYSGSGPTVPDPDADPNWTGYFWTGENFNTANSGGLNTNTSGSCSPLLQLPAIPGFASPNSPTNTLIFVPITADATDLPNHDADGDGCFDIGSSIAITFLNPVSFNPTPGCNGSVSVNITGGYPQFFPAFYTLTNTGAGTLSSTTVSSGGNAVISGLTPGQTYSFSVNDGNGCTATFSGVYSGNPTVAINPAAATVCTGGCVNLNATVTSGVGAGNQTFTSNQCAIIPDGGIGAANNPPTAANQANWAHTSISVSGVCAPSWNTGDNLTVCLNITHTFAADLNIYLQAPNGVYYLLSDDNGGLGANYTGTCFSATAATAITAGTAPFSAGPYKPEGGAGNFAGLTGTPINGSWSLWVADDAALDEGTLNNWSITFTNQNTYTYAWTPAAGLSATNILNPNACPAATTTYTLTVTNSCGCPGTATSTVTVTNSVTPTFDPVTAICSGATLAALPTTSTNGINGTWAPALNNITTTTYTFTPVVGQCAATTTLTITVNPNVTPAFNPVAAICSGDALAALPTTSTNGVTGTWAPALNNTATTTYTFTPAAGQCATTTTLTITVNPLTTPTFNPVAAICSGDALTPLPTTSTNSINGTWAPALNNTATTTYTFTPTAGQCATTTTLTITVNPLITPTFNSVAAICSGDALTSLPTTSTNGINGTWAPALNNTATTTYTFTPAVGQCATTTTLTITVNPLITPTFNPVAAICSGDVLAALPTTSINGINGTWAPALNNTATTTYTFTPAAGQCATTTTFTITVNPLITPTFNPVAAICSGDVLAALPTTSINGINGTWAPALNNTATTTYTFTPAAGQCATTTTLTITVNPLITPAFNPIAAICSGDALAPLPTTSTNGINGTWAPALDNTATTTYTFTPAAGQCATTTTLTITVNPLITPTFNAVAAICSGDALAPLPTTSTNGITGTWAPALNNTATTTYTFTPAAGQCATTTTLTITVNPLITPTFNAVAAICSGDALAPLPTTSTNGINGTWAPALNNTATTTYTFTPAAGQCATTTTITITVNPLVTPTFNAVAAICSGDALATLPTTSTNGINGTWAPALDNTATATYTFTPTAGQCATTTTLTITVNPLITPTFNPVAAICSGDALAPLPTTSTNVINGTWAPALDNTATATYTFTPTAGQCATTTTLTITVNPLITPTFNPVAAICSGDALAPLPTTSTNGINGTWAPTLDNTATTTYTFTPAAGQCATTTTLTITVNPLITPAFNSVAAICSGDALSSLPTTSTNGITGTWAPALDNTATTTYTFTPTAGQCATTTTLTITVNPLITPTFNPVAAICSGDALSPLPTTSTNGITGTWTPALDNTATTTYTFTPAAGQCATTTTLTITVNPLITPTFNPVAAICSGDALAALPTTSINGINGTWAPALDNTATTTYTFTPTAGQCATTTTLTITVNPLITPAFNPIAAICSGDALAPLPTTSTNGINGTWAPALNNTATTTYTFTPAAGQCATTTTLTITVNPLITPTFNAVAAICSGDALAALPTTSTNGVTGTWAPALDNTATTTYTFTPAAGQCATTTTLTITVNPLVTPTFNAIAAICSGDALTPLPITSTNGINGTWSPALDNTATTTYTFTPSAGQCATTTTLTITVNPLITPTFNAVAAICSGDALAALPTTSTNGINGTWAPALDNTATTTYTFTPAAGQCATTTTLTITVNPLITPTFNAVAAICSGDALAPLPTTSTNGITGTWAPVLDNTATTTYTFTPTTGQCATTTTLTITVNPLITPTFNAVAAICSGDLAPVLPTTSTNGITGTWVPAVVDNTVSANYTFVPTAGQCAVSTILNVTVNPLITPTFAAVAAICSGDALAALPTTSTNGINGTWAPALNNTATTTYTFTPSAGQCATTTTLTITVNPLITPTFNAVAAICSGDVLAALPTTSTNGINGTWAPALDNTATTTYTFTPAAGQCATTTTLTITVNPLITPTFNPVAAICSGDALSPLPTTSTNGITGTWAPALDNTATTTYTFTPAAGQCATTTTLTITVNPLITPAFNAVAAICSGDALAALPTTSTNGVTGTWAPALDNTATTTYTFTPAAGQCATTTTLTITVNPLITPTFNAIAAICSGDALTPLPTTSTNGINGTWSPALDNTATTTYTFTPTAGQCATTTTLTITVNPLITPTFNAVAAICSGDAVAPLPTTSINGINGTWAPALDNTATTTYTFTPSAGQCATTTTLTITVNPLITPTFNPVAAICSGDALAPLPTTSTNGINGTWAPALDNTATTTYTFTPAVGQCATTTSLTITVNSLITPTFATVSAICSGDVLAALPTTSTNGINGTWAPALNNTTTTTYIFTAAAGQCATTTTLTITVNPLITPTFNAVPPICSGATAPVLPLTSTNGITGTWTPATVNNLVSATYTFTPGAGQCATQTSITVTVNSNTSPLFNAVAPICAGDALAALPTTSTNGINGTWSPALDNTTTTTYTFTPAAGQCAITTTLTITVNPILSATINCGVSTTSSVTFNWAAVPGATGYNLSYQVGVSPIVNVGPIGNVLTYVVPGLTAGDNVNITLTPTGGAGTCFTSSSATCIATACNPPTANISYAGPFCGSVLTAQTVSLTGTGTFTGGTYSAPAGLTIDGSTGDIIPSTSTAGTYTVTYTIPATPGCSIVTATTAVTIDAVITSAFAAIAAICSGDALAPLPVVSTNGISGAWTPALNNTATTTYTFTPFPGQCAATTTLTITVNPSIIPAFNPVTAICSGDILTPLPTTSTNGINGVWAPALNNTATTTYTFTPTAGQCATTTTLTINVNNNTVPTFNTIAAICSGDILTPLPTTSTNGINGVWSPALNNTATTTYTFTPAAGQCAVTTTLTITVNPIITPTFNPVAAICSGDALAALPTTSTNGINGTWAPALDNTATTTYTFTATAGQCATTTTLTITVNQLITPAFNPVAAICSGDLLAPLPATSTNGISGSWSPALNNTSTTTYTFTPVAGQCATTTTLTITVNPILSATINCGVSTTSSVTFTWAAVPGATGYTVSYQVGVGPIVNVGPIGNVLTYVVPGLTAGDNVTITITPTGGAGTCFTSSSATCTATACNPPTANISYTSPFCASVSTAQTVSLTGTGTFTGGTYSAPAGLTIDGSTGDIVPSTSTAGTYTVTYTISASAGCSAVTATTAVTIDAVVTPSFTSITPICSGTVLTPLPTTSNNGINGTWSPALNNTTTTTYTFTPAAGQCATTTTLMITVNPVVTSTTDITICNNQLPYSWNGNSYPTAGTYSVTLTSASNCDSIATLNLTANAVVTSTTDVSICTNQAPYNWNGNNYPTAGTYSVTLTSSAGCDSIATLNLTINSFVGSTTNATICINQLPYSWNGNSYPAAGTYSVTLTGSTGCDSIATLNLTVNAVVTSTTDITICTTQLPYSWNGNSYPAAGTYSVTLTSSAGCDSIATLNLTANAVVASTTDITICTTQLPYSWNGNSYPTAGTYSVTLTSSAGCDSIATLNLTANAVVTSTTDITICTTQLPYSWNGNSYPTAGTYSVTLTSSAGCDSIATLNLTANAIVTSTTDITICTTQLPYSWNGNTYPTAGTYSVTLISSAGCDSIATLNLTANAVVTSTTNITICTTQLPYSWNGNSYPTAGTYSVTLTSSAGCDSIATLNLTANAVVTSTTDITICTTQLPYSWNGNSYPVAGTYSVTLTSSAGCDSIATLNLTANAVVTSTTDITICTNQVPYNWNGNSYITAGSYPVTLVSSSGCDSIATLNLTIISFVGSTTNITICNNQLPYSWNGNSYPAAGTYSVTLTSSTGCDSIATLILTTNAVVTSTTDISICNNQLPYSWNGNSYPTAGTYSVTLTSSSGCDSIATLNLSVDPVVTSTTDITICINQLPYSWNGNSYPAAGTYSVTLTSSAGCDSIATLNLTANAVVTSTTDASICTNQLPYNWNGNSYPAAGTYSVTLTSSAGCDSIATLNLTVNSFVGSTTNTTICNNQLPYSWNGNSYPAAGTYSVTLTSSSGCDSIATLNLTVNAVVTSTTDITICTTQLPYSWNGNSYPTAGTYSVTLTSSAGCDSIATLNLTTNAVVTSTTDITICTTQLPYSWNGNSYPTTGTYSVTLTGSAGCDSIATLNLTANAVVTSTTDITICTTQLPYSWNGNSYPAAGTYSVTLTSSAGCDSIATLNLSANAVVTSTTDITICTTQLPYSWNGNSYPAAGTYSITLTSSAGCDSIATLNLTDNAVVTSTTDITICTTQLPYSWNGNSYPTAGTYSVTLTSSAGCDSIATLNLTANAVVTSTTDITICINQLPYSWNGNSYPTAGTYSVTLTSSAGCDSIATLNLTANAVVTSTTDITICINQLPYNWNGNSYPAAGTYSVTLTSSAGCDSIATLNLTANAVITSTTDITICTTQLPYSWNGNSYPAAGTYSVTLTSSAGCDSIATLNLTANAVVTSTTDITICTTQLPYSWNGNSYPAAGTYSVTLTSSAGCDSIATLNLTANAVITSTTDITICATQLPYSWNGNSYPTAGTYSVTLTSSSGCDSIATLNLTANAVVTSTTDITICTTQLPYSWNGNSYPTAGTYSVTLTSSAGCDSIATLNLTANTVVTSTTDITICTTQLPYSWNGNSYPVAGTYSVTLTSSAGCDSIATLNLTANAVVTSTTDITICTTQLPYSWNGNSYPAAGTYSVTLISSAGCDSIATLNLTANAVVTSTSDITICTTQLPYSWNGNSYPAAGTYSVTLTSSAGCDSIATLNLTANAVVTSTTDITICTTQLPYSWNGNSYPTAGTYSVTLTSSAGCDSIATLNLTANAVTTSTTNTSICINQLPYNWNGNSYPASGTYSVTLTNAAGCDSIATLNLSATAVVTSTTAITICTTQLPYSWNGNSYPAAGTYSVTLTSTGGCDSIATLNLTANPTVTSTTSTTICNTQLPYNWNGNSYPAAGTYPVTLTSSAGCDSIATLQLYVNNSTTSTTAITICSNQLPYSWNGQGYSTAGPHTVTLVNAAGCDSLATLNLTVNATSTSTTPVTICNTQLPYSWNGQSYSTAGNHSVTLVNAAGCDSVATLNLVVNQASTSLTTANTCTNQLPYNWNGQSYSTAGSHSVTLVNAAGCDSVATLNLIINPVVTSTTYMTTCSNQLPYNWNGQSYPDGGSFTVTLTSAAGCDSIATLNLAVNAVTTSSTSVTVCSGTLPYTWNGQSWSTAGSHAVTLVNSTGCDSIATLNLSVITTPGLATVTTPVHYCQFSTTSPLSASSPFGGSLLWYSSPAGGTGSATVPVPSSANPGALTYYVSQVNAGCEGPRAAITVTINPTPDFTDQPLRICTGHHVNITSLYNTTGFNSSWTMNQQPVADPTSVSEAGAYQLIATSSLGCADTATVNLTVNPPVTANAGNDDNAEYGAPYQLSGSGGVQYQWSPSTDLNNPYIANPVATLTHDQEFILMVMDDIGCFALDTVKLRVLEGPTFYVPSAFSPNGDGLNDIFRPTAVGIAKLEYFSIYNRWGELVYETHDINQGWNGIYKGEKQPIGNYVWKLKGTDRKGILKVMRGNVVLIR